MSEKVSQGDCVITLSFSTRLYQQMKPLFEEAGVTCLSGFILHTVKHNLALWAENKFPDDQCRGRDVGTQVDIGKDGVRGAIHHDIELIFSKEMGQYISQHIQACGGVAQWMENCVNGYIGTLHKPVATLQPSRTKPASRPC